MSTHRGPMAADTKAKIAAALKGKHHPHKGHPLSAATRAKIAAAEKGHPRPTHRGQVASLHRTAPASHRPR